MRNTRAVRAVLALLCVTVTACASAPPMRAPTGKDVPVPGTAEARRTPELPPIPAVDGALHLEIGYPPEGSTIAARDSNFVFGSTGSGRTQLTINGQPVSVSPNGGFLAFIPVPADGLYRLNATKNGETATLERRVTVPAAAAPPTASISAPWPAGVLALVEGETLEVGFRGPAGGHAYVVLPDGARVPLVEQGAATDARPGDEFRTDPGRQQGIVSTARYAGVITATQPLQTADTTVARPRVGSSLPAVPRADGRADGARFELVLGPDTLRAPLRLNLAILNAAVPRAGVIMAPANAPSDWTSRGRLDIAGPFHYFWPAGTRLTITGEREGMYRVRLAGNRTAWVPVGDVRLLAEGTPRAVAIVNSARFSPQPEFIDLRIPTGERLPFQIVEEQDVLHVEVFGAISRINFFQYGGLDPLMTRAEWSQPSDSVLRVSVQLAAPVWGYHAWFDQSNALVVRIRRPPDIDAGAPLRGLVIAVDAGHGGSDRATRGPTGLTEADANLGIALQLQELLTQAGARVFMTRTTDTTVSLADRPRLITDSGAHVSVSVHNNAFPDGVNPWQNNGTSVYYFHPHSIDLARAMQREILNELGLRDIGYGRADLALVRPTWMPAVLTETAFMMIPEQESALRDTAVQRRIAAAHVRALEAFLQARAARR
jgi:N-acetylmuramoyl-L-alanine amidase